MTDDMYEHLVYDDFKFTTPAQIEPSLYAGDFLRLGEQIDAAENLGFDSLWVTEHHFRYFGGMMPSPSVLLAAAAQRD
jgi:alkanesulfonate monooxygenase SsuD/methylene tetrahydromethanopterin reductase-like flavin-dependent oxidoreductase (luciferase family)